MEFDLTSICIGLAIFLLSAIVIYAISALTMREKTFEEVMEEQRSRHLLLQPTATKAKVDKKQQQKKQKKSNTQPIKAPKSEPTPAVDANKKSGDGNKKSVDANKKSVDVNKTSVDANKKDVDANKKDVGANKKSAGVNKKSVDVNKKSVGGNKKSADVVEEHKMVQYELEPEIIQPVQASAASSTPESTNRKSKKNTKPILVNKNEKTLVKVCAFAYFCPTPTEPVCFNSQCFPPVKPW